MSESNLPGIRKSTFTGSHPYLPGPKAGDRVIIDMGDGKTTDHIATAVTRDGYGGFAVTSRPATAQDGPRTREQRKMVRAMRNSRRRRKMRAWVGRVTGRDRDV